MSSMNEDDNEHEPGGGCLGGNDQLNAPASRYEPISQGGHSPKAPRPLPLAQQLGTQGPKAPWLRGRGRGSGIAACAPQHGWLNWAPQLTAPRNTTLKSTCYTQISHKLL